MSQYIVFSIGFLAQALFSARLIIQWIASERAKKVLSPTIFWQLSMIASFMLCVYGWLRDDFAIILGQLLAYYIYIWNLNAKGAWRKLPAVMRGIFISLPVAAIIYFIVNWSEAVSSLFESEDVGPALLIFGVAGQVIFAMRFLYQWWYSSKKGESVLPPVFWIISLTGSVMILTYAVLRLDPVLFVGQAFGAVVYLRNIVIGFRFGRQRKENVCTHHHTPVNEDF